ncbi:hypothetical protein GUITHDRAFT_157129 [Guillardia theta CCMP2712]|uniref:Glycosyltransferase 2-like domain-containing protein n=1 Tax=Guillardia theta (strain CCMP2712) TaxID=905079 RepID=L1JW69_GUITC|nr:hypothetical protein GUITHDRAFT_157129 [Guillardia theta CCMP2712]EKX52328.1 hypothetical protein GUITHDRAFT_157129 [Guillardia theta CCMP2712]|eukprot:XP_005839308.1 hypothetical protein GUITHDRAFT_157129 [Guillardia theta CCMP2712]
MACLSVLLPVFNAQPWLPLAVRSIMQQQLGDGRSLQLICVDDASSDGSLEFLLELARLLGDRATKRIRIGTNGDRESTNPALLNMQLRAAEEEDHPSFTHQEEPEDVKQLRTRPVTAEEVAASSLKEHSLKVLTWKDGVNRGQGAAMSIALSKVNTKYLAQMESDDERSNPDAYRIMLEAMEANASWDGVSCQSMLTGWERPGMQRYIEWQNTCLTTEEMRRGRFIEMPALHQTGLFLTSSNVEVWSVGRTLDEWEADLKQYPLAPPKVRSIEWKPGRPLPGKEEGEEARPVRLFAFGHPKARTRVREQVKDWDDEYDWFVA